MQPSRILFLDSIGGLLVGAVVLIAHGWLASWYGFPEKIVLFTGFANLAYGTFSGSLALRSQRPVSLITLLASANMLWTFACVGILLRHGAEASVFGVLHVAAEGVYVGALGLVEWRWRERIASAVAT
ncbi:MAG: hypothetical protein AAGG01_05350 [Planctomycetota bacterium]